MITTSLGCSRRRRIKLKGMIFGLLKFFRFVIGVREQFEWESGCSIHGKRYPAMEIIHAFGWALGNISVS